MNSECSGKETCASVRTAATLPLFAAASVTDYSSTVAEGCVYSEIGGSGNNQLLSAEKVKAGELSKQ